MAKRHYGLEVSDVVMYEGVECEVVGFSSMDNNRVQLVEQRDAIMGIYKNNFSAVAEWCKKIDIDYENKKES